jgi:uroporphyrinogen decarboxylase
MTPRERVLSAFDHRESDRVPVDLGSHLSSGIAAVAYPRLRKFLGLPHKPVRIHDMVQQLAVVDDDVLDRFRIDTVEMGRGFLLDEKDWKEWVLVDGTPCLIPYYINVEKRGEDWYLLADNGHKLGIQKKDWMFFEQTYFPLLEREIEHDDFSDLEDILPQTLWTGVSHPGAHLPLTEEGLTEMSRRAKDLRESTERAIVGLFGGNMVEIPQYLYRMDNYLLHMKLHPDAIVRLSEKLCSLHLKNLEKWLGAVGPYIDIVFFGDDLGSQSGLLFSPEMYRRYFKPYHEKLWRRAKELANVKVVLHSCGNVRGLMDDFVEAGLEGINPIQINCKGMEPPELKREFGKQLTFWGGGCDTRDVLPRAAPREVAEHVRAQIGVLNREGGFIFQQVHNIMPDVPPENIVAMFDAVNSCRSSD